MLSFLPAKVLDVGVSLGGGEALDYAYVYLWNTFFFGRVQNHPIVVGEGMRPLTFNIRARAVWMEGRCGVRFSPGR